MKARKYRFYEKKQSFGGRFALVMACIGLLLLIISIVISYAARGSGGLLCGGIAFIGMLVTGLGFFAGIRSFQEKDTAPRFGVIGTITAGTLFIAYIAVFLYGLA